MQLAELQPRTLRQPPGHRPRDAVAGEVEAAQLAQRSAEAGRQGAAQPVTGEVEEAQVGTVGQAVGDVAGQPVAGEVNDPQCAQGGAKGRRDGSACA